MITDNTRKQLAEREARIATLETRGEDTTKQLAAARDECRRLADALADCQAELQAWATATYSDTPASLAESVAASVIEVVELRALNERLLADAQRLTAELQQVEAVRDAGIREAVAAERDARAERLADALRQISDLTATSSVYPSFANALHTIAARGLSDAPPPAVEPALSSYIRVGESPPDVEAVVAPAPALPPGWTAESPGHYVGPKGDLVMFYDDGEFGLDGYNVKHTELHALLHLYEAHHGKVEPPKKTCPDTDEAVETRVREAMSYGSQPWKSPNAAAAQDRASDTGESSSHVEPEGLNDSGPARHAVEPACRAAEGSPDDFPQYGRDYTIHVGESAPEVTAAAREPEQRIFNALRLLRAIVAFSPDVLTTPRSNIEAVIAELDHRGAPQAAAQPVRDGTSCWDDVPWSCWRCGPGRDPRRITSPEDRGSGCGACDWTGVDLQRYVRNHAPPAVPPGVAELREACEQLAAKWEAEAAQCSELREYPLAEKRTFTRCARELRGLLTAKGGA